MRSRKIHSELQAVFIVRMDVAAVESDRALDITRASQRGGDGSKEICGRFMLDRSPACVGCQPVWAP